MPARNSSCRDFLGYSNEFRPERFPARDVIYAGDNCFGEQRMSVSPFKLPSDDVMANVRLSVTVTSLYTLVGLGVVIVFL